MPGHFEKLYEAAEGSYRGHIELQKLARVLTEYSTVSSTDDGDVAQMTLMENSILVMESASPVHLATHQFGPEKEAEAIRQVQGLLKKGMIELAGGACM